MTTECLDDSYDNKTLWKTIKPFLSDKLQSTNKMTLIGKEEIIMGDYNTVQVMNTFFSNIVRNLNIAEYSICEPLANNISDPVLKCVAKYRSHPSILAIEEVCNKHPTRLPFSISKINGEEILRQILKLETSKKCQDTDIPTKLSKRMWIYLLTSFLQVLIIFPSSLKKAALLHFRTSPFFYL